MRGRQFGSQIEQERSFTDQYTKSAVGAALQNILFIESASAELITSLIQTFLRTIFFYGIDSMK